jgi:hypothetical protein
VIMVYRDKICSPQFYMERYQLEKESISEIMRIARNYISLANNDTRKNAKQSYLNCVEACGIALMAKGML